MSDVASSTDVAVSFAPRQLLPSEQWRFVLRRIYPRAVNPLWTATYRWLILTAYLALVGVSVSLLTESRASRPVMAGLGAVVGLVMPYRLWRIKRILLRSVGPTEAYTVTLSPAGATVETASRVLLLRWIGATSVLVTRHEVVIQYRTLDVVSVPLNAFGNDAHLGRFVTAARSNVAAAAERRDQA